MWAGRPFTWIRPAAIHSSTVRREASPARASAFCSFSDVSAAERGSGRAEGRAPKRCRALGAARSGLLALGLAFGALLGVRAFGDFAGRDLRLGEGGLGALEALGDFFKGR